MASQTAFLTGGASGIGAAVTRMLHSRGVKVVIADRDVQAAEAFARSIDPEGEQVISLEADVASWDSQATAFELALERLGRIDYVFPIAGVGERVFVPNDDGRGHGFVKPDLTAIDVNLNGFIYTAALAIQQMRRQSPDDTGCRGRILGTASVCGFYCVPTLPVYTASKHGVVGFVRCYGKYLPEEQIFMNAICPHVLRTNIASPEFYDSIEPDAKLVEIQGVVGAFESLLDSNMSGECIEVGPNGGFHLRQPAEVLDEESGRLNEMLYHRSRPLHRGQK